MVQINSNYLKLKAGYLFPEIGRRVAAYKAAHPAAPIIRLGIGDVTEPLVPAVIEAMHRAVDDMSRRETFHGYGPEQGYDWLREKIAEQDFQARGAEVDPGEIFISDGSKCDTANILDILGRNMNVIAVTDPVYPVYVDTNVMHGNTGMIRVSGEYESLVYLPMTAENGFNPPLPSQKVDVIYLCSPNNPTGAVLGRQALERWVKFAREHQSLILFDAAYEAYITSPEVPHSIYEIEGARDVAIEFRSFSKTAGFTGVRCGCTIIPETLTGKAADGGQVALHRLWMRRHTTKFNGVSYITQRGAEACYSPEGRAQIKATVAFYLENAAIIRATMGEIGLAAHGGVDAPYVWVHTPGRTTSWQFFDRLLDKVHIVVTPGSGFGTAGEGYFRVSAFNSRENVLAAMARLKQNADALLAG